MLPQHRGEYNKGRESLPDSLNPPCLAWCLPVLHKIYILTFLQMKEMGIEHVRDLPRVPESISGQSSNLDLSCQIPLSLPELSKFRGN